MNIIFQVVEKREEPKCCAVCHFWCIAALPNLAFGRKTT